MIIQITLRYHVLQWRDRVFFQGCHFRCLVILKASTFLVSYGLQVVVVALIVDWDGLPVCCDVYWFFHGWRHLRKGCWSLYVEYDLLIWCCASAGNIDTTLADTYPNFNTQQIKNETANVVVQKHSHKLLKMDILMPEICWVSKK